MNMTKKTVFKIIKKRIQLLKDQKLFQKKKQKQKTKYQYKKIMKIKKVYHPITRLKEVIQINCNFRKECQNKRIMLRNRRIH